jgi:hypothetical protein
VLKAEALKDTFDEWLGRVVCWCFDLSPQALVKEMNRSTAQTGKEAAQEEGLEPLKLSWKDILDVVLVKAFDAPDLEMAYADEEIADPATKAEVMATALGKGGGKPWLTQDEVRAEYGYDELDDAQREELNPAPPPEPTGPTPEEQQASAQKDAETKAEITELRKRADALAADQAQATGLLAIAEALGKRQRTTTALHLERDADGVLSGATRVTRS